MLKANTSILHVSNYCRNTIYEFQHYIWDDYRRHKDDYDLKEQVKKKNDHFMDCLRYIYNHDPRYIEKETEEDAVSVKYEGTYTKYPSKETSGRGSYRDLIDTNAGRF
jgi:hypothetical protein